ncbi:hypothetical protein QF047_001895 [Arthrobacter sp. W4I7]|nr:hypothetical protein [Arthrobacter sp. W4I7]
MLFEYQAKTRFGGQPGDLSLEFAPELLIRDHRDQRVEVCHPYSLNLGPTLPREARAGVLDFTCHCEPVRPRTHSTGCKVGRGSPLIRDPHFFPKISGQGFISVDHIYAGGMDEPGIESPEPYWLVRMRQAAKQRPKTRFVKIRWLELQYLLRERDALWLAAGPAVRQRLLKLRETDDYTYLSLQEIGALQTVQEEEPGR